MLAKTVKILLQTIWRTIPHTVSAAGKKGDIWRYLGRLGRYLKQGPREVPIGNFEKALYSLQGPYKVLRRFGSSAYELDILRDPGINPVFSV